MFFLLVIAGVFVGLMSSFFGVGGGVLIVPTLYGLFEGIPPQTVIGTSLTLICINSALNTYNFYRLGQRIPIVHQMTLAICMAIGVLFGGDIIGKLSPDNIKLFFGIALLLISLRTLLKKEKNGEQAVLIEDNKFFLTLGISSLLGGLISGMTGLGGGVILVPLLITVVKVPFKLVSLYSNLGMLGGTFVGALSYMIQDRPEYSYPSEILTSSQVGHVNMLAVALLFIGSVTTSKLGAKLNGKVDPVLSRRLFGALLLFMALRILMKHLSF